MESTNRCTKAMARTQQVLKSFTLKSHQKQLMLMGGEERKNKEEHQIPPRSRPKSFSSLRGEIDWWNGRSRSPLSFSSNWKQESWRNREIAKLQRVNNGGQNRAQELVNLWGRRPHFIGPKILPFGPDSCNPELVRIWFGIPVDSE